MNRVDYESHFICKETITGKKAFSHYIKLVKLRDKKKIATYNDRDKIIKSIFQEVQNAIVEDVDGVVMDGLGYFSVVKQPIIGKIVKNAKVSQAYREKTYNTHSNYYIYNLMFIPDVVVGWKRLTGTSMDRSFNNTLKARVSKALKGGKKYMFKYNLATALLAHQQKKTKKYFKKQTKRNNDI